jgi:Flp pilus assembly protein TadG
VTGAGTGPRAESGQATVELALCLPLIVLLLGGVVQVGLIAGDQIRLWHAAREAARVAVVDPDPAAARRAAERVGLSGLEVSIDPLPAHRVQGEPLTVSLTCGPQRTLPILGSLLGGVDLRARASMGIEQP